MRAQNLTISVPYKGCDKDCPYCVSKMTGYIEADEDAFQFNLVKARTLAKAAQVSSVLITGKGEPFLNLDACERVSTVFKDFPIEIQTNGKMLYKNWKDGTSILGSKYLNVIAFSIDSFDDWKKYVPMMEHLWDSYGIVIRVTLNVTSLLGDIDKAFDSAIKLAEKSKVSQLSFRSVTIPERTIASIDSTDAEIWIQNNHCAEYYDRITRELNELTSSKCLLRQLSFGVSVYDLFGIAVTKFDNCIQEWNNGEDIRSLIYQEDGHMYTSWDSPASILF